MIEIFGFPVGTISQLGTFGAIIIAVIMIYPKLKEQDQSHAERMCAALSSEVVQLRDRLLACERECQESKALAAREIKELHDQLYAMRDQRMQEQISMISAILQTVDNPELRKQLVMLESVQAGLRVQKERRDAEASET